MQIVPCIASVGCCCFLMWGCCFLLLSHGVAQVVLPLYSSPDSLRTAGRVGLRVHHSPIPTGQTTNQKTPPPTTTTPTTQTSPIPQDKTTEEKTTKSNGVWERERERERKTTTTTKKQKNKNPRQRWMCEYRQSESARYAFPLNSRLEL